MSPDDRIPRFVPPPSPFASPSPSLPSPPFFPCLTGRKPPLAARPATPLSSPPATPAPASPSPLTNLDEDRRPPLLPPPLRLPHSTTSPQLFVSSDDRHPGPASQSRRLTSPTHNAQRTAPARRLDERAKQLSAAVIRRRPSAQPSAIYHHAHQRSLDRQ